MLDFITSQRAAFILALSDLYRDGTLSRSGDRVPDGRGGYSGGTADFTVKLHKEHDHSTLADRNIEPDQALIYVLNTDAGPQPQKGDAIRLDGTDYQVLSLTTDPVTVAWECVCTQG